MERTNAWKAYGAADEEAVESLAADYIDFISTCKTEREAAARAIELARAAGYVSLEEARAQGKPLAPGDKVYASNFGKSVMLVQLGRAPLEEGFNILGAHIDSPRMDVKQNPLYESNQEVPVGDPAARDSRRRREKGRDHGCDQRGRRPRRPGLLRH